jgi:hypothetical protein
MAPNSRALERSRVLTCPNRSFNIKGVKKIPVAAIGKPPDCNYSGVRSLG